ncbi:hypothetical protein BH11PSE3_BH11PSE3_26200 [soil metagenome]
MTFRILTLVAALGLASSAALAQTAPLTFDRAAYISCRDAQAMAPAQRSAVAVFLAEHVARYRGVVLPDGEAGAQLAHLVRGGCTLAPDAYLFTVIDRAIAAEAGKLVKR